MKKVAEIDRDYDHLSRQIRRAGGDTEAVLARLSRLRITFPSSAIPAGGPVSGSSDGAVPRRREEALADNAVVHRLTGIAGGVRLIGDGFATPVDHDALRLEASASNLAFDAVEVTPFPAGAMRWAMRPGGPPAGADLLARAIESAVAVIAHGQQLGCRRLIVAADGLADAFGRGEGADWIGAFLCYATPVYRALPADWTMALALGAAEPGRPDWKARASLARKLGRRARCLVDVADVSVASDPLDGLNRQGLLGGLWFGGLAQRAAAPGATPDDPYRLFRALRQSIELGGMPSGDLCLCAPRDTPTEVSSPIERMLLTAEAIVQAYAKALLVDGDALASARSRADRAAALQIERRAFNIDVTPLVALARIEAGGAADPLAAYRASGSPTLGTTPFPVETIALHSDRRIIT